MSDGITDASREDTKDIEYWKRTATDQLLATFSKEDLLRELSKRNVLEQHNIDIDRQLLKDRGFVHTDTFILSDPSECGDEMDSRRWKK